MGINKEKVTQVILKIEIVEQNAFPWKLTKVKVLINASRNLSICVTNISLTFRYIG